MGVRSAVESKVNMDKRAFYVRWKLANGFIRIRNYSEHSNRIYRIVYFLKLPKTYLLKAHSFCRFIKIAEFIIPQKRISIVRRNVLCFEVNGVLLLHSFYTNIWQWGGIIITDCRLTSGIQENFRILSEQITNPKYTPENWWIRINFDVLYFSFIWLSELGVNSD